MIQSVARSVAVGFGHGYPCSDHTQVRLLRSDLLGSALDSSEALDSRLLTGRISKGNILPVLKSTTVGTCLIPGLLHSAGYYVESLKGLGGRLYIGPSFCVPACQLSSSLEALHHFLILLRAGGLLQEAGCSQLWHLSCRIFL